MNKKLERILNKSNYELDSLGTDEEDSISIDDAFDVVRRAFVAANELILKYRPITKLTNREITEAMTKFFDVDEKEIYGIKRQNNPIPQVNIKIGIDDANAVWIAIRDPFESCPWFSDENHRIEYYQWCIAKGVCIWLKDNPYLEAENETESN